LVKDTVSWIALSWIPIPAANPGVTRATETSTNISDTITVKIIFFMFISLPSAFPIGLYFQIDNLYPVGFTIGSMPPKRPPIVSYRPITRTETLNVLSQEPIPTALEDAT
jgi:hypothetical protein